MKRLLYLASLIILGACAEQGREGMTILRIESEPSQSQVVFLEELHVREIMPVDSILMSGEEATELSFQQQDQGFYLLRFADGMIITLFLEPGEELDVKRFSDGERRWYEVKGSPGSGMLRDYFLRKTEDEQHADSLGKVFRDSRDRSDFVQIREKLDSSYFALLDHHTQWVEQYILSCDTSIVSLFLLNQRFGRQQVFNEENAFALMEHLDSMLYGRYQDNTHVVEHHLRVTEHRRAMYEIGLANEKLAPGNMAPELEMFDSEGRDWKLSGMAGSKILLHFWAASDAPSRIDNRKLVSFVRKHPELKTVSVSMDNSREAWAAAVALDGLSWTNVSELIGMGSPAGEKYLPGLKLPFYYVIDKDGRILLRAGSISELDRLYARL